MALLRTLRNILSGRFRRADSPYSFATLFNKFRSILDKNNQALELIADMGDKLGGDYVFDRQYILSITEQLTELVYLLIYDLNTLAPNKYLDLLNSFERIRVRIQAQLEGNWILPEGDTVIAYSNLDIGLNEEVGNKNATLAEIRNVLELPVPDGFTITASAFKMFLEWNKLAEPILKALNSWEHESQQSTEETSAAIRKLILDARVPPSLIQQITHALERISANYPKPEGNFFAVRSSAIGEDGEHSFAGQYKTSLNVPQSQLLEHYKMILASAYFPNALAYSSQKGFLANEIAMAVGCQLMIDVETSGVLYTLDPTSPEKETALVAAVWGLGAPLVEGRVQSDQYVVSRDPPHNLQALKIVRKPDMLVSRKGGNTEHRAVPDELQSRPCLNPEHLSKLVEMGLLIERYFKRPQDIEWALDRDGNLVILQARALNIKNGKDDLVTDISEISSNYPVLFKGEGTIVQRGIATGNVFLVGQDEDLSKVPFGSILVAKHTSPRLAGIIRKVHGIITDVGSPTGHMATIAREFRVPTIVNTRIATQTFHNGDEITLDATQGVVYGGKVKELSYYEFTVEDVFEDSYEYRLLRRILREISPLNLVDPHDKDFKPAKCKTYHDIIRFIHEKAVKELINLEHVRRRELHGAARRLDFEIPLGLTVIDIGGGIQSPNSDDAIGFTEINSIPMRAFLVGLMEPGMWDTDPVSVDFGSFMSSLTRTFSSSLASPELVGQNLAVISGEYLDLSLRLGYHFNIIDAYISDSPNDNYAYFRFIGGVTDIVRRSRRARLIAAILERLNFRVELRGDLVVGRIKKLERAIMEEKLWMLGGLVSYTRQLDIRLDNDEQVDQFLQDFTEKMPKPNSMNLQRRLYGHESQNTNFDTGR